MKHKGDITKLNGADLEPVWCIVGGSPCQDLSVAGKRAGLSGERSGLFMEQIRVTKEMRENDKRSGRTGELVRPRYLVWENVPGAFSSNFKDGFGDFGAVLEEIIRIAEPDFTLPRLQKGQKWTKAGAIFGEGYSVAWRTHDAQFWGVPQRRRRISIVADFGGESAGEILFERQGLPRDPDESEPKGKEVTRDSSESTGVDDCCVAVDCFNQSASDTAFKGLTSAATDSDHVPCMAKKEAIGVDIYNTSLTGDKACSLTSQGYGSTGTCPKVAEAITIEPGIASREGGHYYENVSGTLRANAGDNQMAVAKEEPILLESNQNHATVQTDGISTALPASMGMGGGYVPMVTEKVETVALEGNGQRQSHRGDGYKETDKMYTLNTTEVHGVAYGICSDGSNSMKSGNPNSGIYEADTSRTLDGNCCNPSCNQGGIAICEEKPYTLKIRGGVDTDSNGKKAGKGALIQEDMSATLGTSQDQTLFQPVVEEGKNFAEKRFFEWEEDEKSVTLRNCGGSYGNGSEVLHVEPVAYQEKCGPIMARDFKGPGNEYVEEDKLIVESIPCLDAGMLNYYNDICPSQLARQYKDPPIIAVPDENEEPYVYKREFGGSVTHNGISPTIEAACGTGGNNQPIITDKVEWNGKADGASGNGVSFAITGDHDNRPTDMTNVVVSKVVRWIVRRLTPKECERLQGYPDDWTNIGEWVDSKGKVRKEADAPRYKALGNSIALPFWYWMLKRMAHYLPEKATLGSLFDGIGGFPLCWESIHGKGTALWASEIEEFPIAVTKIRFPEGTEIDPT